MRWELPVLALRNTVIPPGVQQNVSVGRSKSKRAVEESQAADRRIILLTQRDQRSDDPTGGDLYEYGTLAAVKQVVRLPDQTIEVLVEGLERVKIQHYLPTPYLRAAVDTIETPREGDNNVFRVLMDEAKSSFEKYVAQNKALRLDSFQVDQVRATTDPNLLSDQITHLSSWEVPDKQVILEVLSVRARLERVIALLGRDLERFELDKQIAARVKEQMDQNQREYYLREQMKAIGKELGGSEEGPAEIDDLRDRIEKAGMPDNVRAKAMKELHRLERTPGGSPEGTVVRNYLDWLLETPWARRDEEILEIARTRVVLDEDHFGLEDVKERILEFLAVRQLTAPMREAEEKRRAAEAEAKKAANAAATSEGEAGKPGPKTVPDQKDRPEDFELRAPILCLVGPPGVGKTSLGKSVARSLGRQFVRMSLGGVRDEAEIRGHRRTYIGSMPGRIIQAMKTAGVTNPIILLDEIDKLSSDWRGDPSSALLEVLDPEQNHTFQDHYLEVPYDLSKVMFITTANSLSTIPRPLLDRMEVIQIPGYTQTEKLAIAKNFRLPKQLKSHGLDEHLEVADSALRRIIEEYTQEAGVRNLDRQIAKLTRKAAREFLENRWQDKKQIEGQDVPHYLGIPIFRPDRMEKEPQVGVAQGMAWTAVGGTLLVAESLAVPGSGKVNLTGQLGDVMKESAQAAITYLRAHSAEYGAPEDFYKTTDIHVHFPEGATPKDGPSAGITIATSVISAITKRPVRLDVAMTGEITLRGRVLPIGGLKEKLMAAYQAGIRRVVVPRDNEPNLQDVPESIKGEMDIALVENVGEVLEYLLLPAPVAAEVPQPTLQPPLSQPSAQVGA
jgi:ATP-dependent Lon protease